MDYSNSTQIKGVRLRCAIPIPDVQAILSATVNRRHDSFNAVLLSGGETVEEIACGGRVFNATSFPTLDVAGMPRTPYRVTVPVDPEGIRRVTVRCDGEPPKDAVEFGGRDKTRHC